MEACNPCRSLAAGPPTQLRTAVANRGLETGTPRELYLEDDEVFTDQEAPPALEIRTLLSSVFGGEFGADVYGGHGERTQNRLVMVAGINTTYLRAVAKVAFHYLLWACPILRGSDPVLCRDPRVHLGRCRQLAGFRPARCAPSSYRFSSGATCRHERVTSSIPHSRTTKQEPLFSFLSVHADYRRPRWSAWPQTR